MRRYQDITNVPEKQIKCTARGRLDTCSPGYSGQLISLRFSFCLCGHDHLVWSFTCVQVFFFCYFDVEKDKSKGFSLVGGGGVGWAVIENGFF